MSTQRELLHNLCPQDVLMCRYKPQCYLGILHFPSPFSFPQPWMTSYLATSSQISQSSSPILTKRILLPRSLRDGPSEEDFHMIDHQVTYLFTRIKYPCSLSTPKYLILAWGVSPNPHWCIWKPTCNIHLDVQEAPKPICVSKHTFQSLS